MASSTLDLVREARQVLGKRHDTESLGPSGTPTAAGDQYELMELMQAGIQSEADAKRHR